jgi:GNAT superfamily N-acetyltransferase
LSRPHLFKRAIIIIKAAYMKRSELRKLIREEVRNVLKETKSEEKEFDKFKKILDDMGDGSYEIDYLDENGNPVAFARGGKFNEFTTLEFIKIEDEYQGLGYSKFIYRDALEHAKEQGSEGLMVGGQLLQASKSRATYKNFKNYEHSLKNERGNPYIVLTDFIKD